MNNALTAARDYLEHQRPDDPPDESLDDLTYTFAIRSAAHAIERAPTLTDKHGATIVLTWELTVGVVELEARPSGATWQSNGIPLTTVLEALRDRDERPEWTTDDLRPAFSELDAAATSCGRLTLRKQPWRAPLEEDLDRTLWMGPSMAGFERWVLKQGWRELATIFFARPGVAVVVEDNPVDWGGAGPRIEAASSSGELTPAENDTELQTHLQLQRREDELPLWRAASLCPETPLPPAVQARLWGVATSAAAWVLAEDRTNPHRVRPRRDRARAYDLPDTPPDLNDRSGGAIRELVSWVAEDLNAARIAVAQRVAVAEIADPFDTTPVPPIKQAADIGYRVVIDRTVEDALERQTVFEQTFVDLDKSVAEIRSDISSTVEQVVTRTLVGASAFTIAALASPSFRGAAALVAGALIAVFVAANLVLLCRSTRPEVLRRLQDANDQIAKRRAKLSPELSEALTNRLGLWKHEVEHLIRLSAVILAALIVALLGAGLSVALATDYEGSSPSPPHTCHVTGPYSTCTCSTPRSRSQGARRQLRCHRPNRRRDDARDHRDRNRMAHATPRADRRACVNRWRTGWPLLWLRPNKNHHERH